MAAPTTHAVDPVGPVDPVDTGDTVTAPSQSSHAVTAGRPPRWRRHDSAWLAITLVAVGIAALIPLAYFHRFYFVNDTETGAFGVWYKLGTNLRAGHIQIFDPHAWMAGNYVAEGQWGFFNPVVLLIGLLASVSANAVVFCSILKIVLLLIGASGTFVLARSFGADVTWAAVAGTAVPLSGFTTYMDSTAWVTGLMIWAALPWFWSALRRAVHGGNPGWALVLGYLAVTVGYVYGAIGVVFILLGVGVEQIIARHWRGVRTTVGLGLAAGLVTVTVYLPGILTSSVTTRQASIGNDGFLSPSLSAIAGSAIPTAQPQLHGYWGQFAHTPLLYICWFLPLVAFIDWRAAKRVLSSMTGALIALALFGALLFGPSQVDALRYPVRNMSMFVLILLSILATLWSHARAPRSRGRLFGAWGLTFASAFFAYSARPGFAHTIFLTAGVAAIGIAIVWLLQHDTAATPPATPTTDADASAGADAGAGVRGRPGRRVSAALTAAVIIVISVGYVPVQHHDYPRSDLLANFLPSSVQAYKAVQPKAINDGITVGGPKRVDPKLWREQLLANSWYVNAHNFQNVYTPVGFLSYSRAVCMNFLGNTCPSLLNGLFRVRAATGLRLVDELGIDTIVILKSRVPPGNYNRPRHGWSIVSDQPLTITWTRDNPVGPAGKPVKTSDGLAISDVHSSDRTVSFHVDAVGDSSGRVVFSRLNWPGYTASNASVATPADHFLLRVAVPRSSAGKTVTVTFTPPGWHLGLAFWALSIVGSISWIIVAGAMTLRRRRSSPA